nr:MAG: hypothetical protein [Bacteriophage sp.]UWF95577.1 MAG: hypothetical protein [Bacteriophage sp.]UWG18243.1 MAG: hypothetical protein [Bacteriophage sp.]
MHNGYNVLNFVLCYVCVVRAQADKIQQRIEAVQHKAGDSYRVEPVNGRFYNARAVSRFQYRRE